VPGNTYSPSVFATHDTYADGRLATEQREQWSTGLDGTHPSYSRTALENAYDGTGRLERAIKRIWYFTEPGSEFNSTSWEQIDYLYGDKRFSTRRMATSHGASQSVQLPTVVELDDFVVDALGKVIPTRQRWLDGIGLGYDGQVTFHPNGVEAAESWKGRYQWYTEARTSQFDDAGNPLLEDSSSFRAGNGTNRWHLEYTYETGSLTERHIEAGLYSDFTGEPLLGGTRFLETYIYDGADPAKGSTQRLARFDTKATDGSCTIEQADRTCVANCPFVSNCTWTDRPEQHTAFRYDDYGNLVERAVTDETGNEILRWNAVADKDGNLLCEKLTAAGVLRSFSQYDYSCW
jgi:hypothetical protein